MTVTIVNKTNHPLDFWLVIAGGPKYWDNNVKPESRMEHHPGYVWYDLHAKLNTGPDNELGIGGAILSGILPFWALPGFIINTLIKTDIVKNSELLPAKLKGLLDAGSYDVDNKVEIKDVEWTNIYGGGDDKTFEVTGGGFEWHEEAGVIKVTGWKALVLNKTSG